MDWEIVFCIMIRVLEDWKWECSKTIVNNRKFSVLLKVGSDIKCISLECIYIHIICFNCGLHLDKHRNDVNYCTPLRKINKWQGLKVNSSPGFSKNLPFGILYLPSIMKYMAKCASISLGIKWYNQILAK